MILQDKITERMAFMAILTIRNLHVNVADQEILKGIDLTIQEGEIHALMGPNGNGKSTLLAAIMGNPKYQVTQGSITLDDRDVLAMEVDERSRAGLFLGMQYPSEISGVTNSDFLRAAINARREKPIPLFTFIKEMEQAIKEMDMKSDLAHRFLNEGFSGGEKKRNEILQLKLLRPCMAMLDEIDSGLDVDALKLVAKEVKDLQERTKMGLLVVSHYERFYELLKPTHAHVLIDGRIVMSDDAALIKKIDAQGYDWIGEELGITIRSQEQESAGISTLGVCGAKQRGDRE